MKPRNKNLRSSLFFTVCIAASLPVAVHAADFTWDGTADGGAATGDPLWSNANNWVGDVAPSSGTVVTTAADVTIASTTLTAVDTTGIVVGAVVTGTGIDVGSTVTAVGATTVELSLAATASAIAESITFTPGVDNLIFDGVVGLANVNDFITKLDNPAFTFAAGAGAYVVDDDGLAGPITVGTTAGGSVVATVNSTADQEIALDLTLAGNQKDRQILFGAGAGKLTLSGDINFSNSWLFPNSAGIVELTGNNSGDGRGGLHNAGTNTMRSMCRLNSGAGLTLALGSPTALGNPNVDFANQRALRMNTGSQVLTTVGGMDLVGANMVNNTISYNESTSYVGAGDLEVGGLTYTKTNGRSWNVDGGGEFIISGQGVMITTRAEAQLMILQPLNGNVITINGPIHDTFQSGGIVTQTTGNGGVLTDGILRLQGSGTVNINADNLATFNGETFLNSANLTVKLGNANALGTWVDTLVEVPTEVMTTGTTFNGDTIIYDIDPTGISVGDVVSGTGIPVGAVVTSITIDEFVIGESSLEMDLAATADGSLVDLTFNGTSTTGTIAGRTDMNAGSLDLNGFAVNETFIRLGGNAKFINSNTGTPAQILSEIVQQGNFTMDGPGDIIINNIYRNAGGSQRYYKKYGTGTLTIGGDVTNNRYNLDLFEGDVILAKTAGEALNRYGIRMYNAASTITLTIKGDQINENADQTHQINEGTIDLNGFSDTICGLGLTLGTEPGGVITNNGGSTSTLTLAASNADKTWPGTISGDLNLVKQGTQIQNLGIVVHTGSTTIDGGTLELGAASDLADASAVNINGATSILKLADGVTDTVNELWIDGGQVEAGTYGATGSTADNIDDVHFAGTGVLDVTTGDPVASDYDTWAALYSPADLTDMAGDNDSDGLDNNNEYAFGLSPVDGSSVSPYLPGADVAGGTFTYQRRKTTGLTYTIEISLDLLTWTPDLTATQTPTDIDANNESVAVTIPGPLPDTAFVRVSAE